MPTEVIYIINIDKSSLASNQIVTFETHRPKETAMVSEANVLNSKMDFFVSLLDVSIF